MSAPTIPTILLDTLRTLSLRPDEDHANGTLYGVKVFGPNGSTDILDVSVIEAGNIVKSIVAPEQPDMSELIGLKNKLHRTERELLATHRAIAAAMLPVALLKAMDMPVSLEELQRMADTLARGLLEIEEADTDR